MDTNYIWSYSFPMKKGVLDDDYYFYDDGRILHFYDKTQNKLNIEEYIDPESIDVNKRRLILESCPVELKGKISSMLKIKLEL